MRRHLIAFLGATLVLGAGAGVATASSTPRLTASGPTSVSGTDANARFTIADRVIRQVRYVDHGVLVYRFALENPGALPVTVTGLAPLARAPKLFGYLSLQDGAGRRRFTLDPGEETPVELRMRMQACEHLSARAGSFATDVALRVSRVRVLDDVVVVRLPEEVHTGSPREAFCPNSTATSRPPG